MLASSGMPLQILLLRKCGHRLADGLDRFGGSGADFPRKGSTKWQRAMMTHNGTTAFFQDTLDVRKSLHDS